MTTKEDYSKEEWDLLLEIPPIVGLAVMMAGKSGFGTMKEAWAMTRGVLDAKDGYEGNELIHALVDARIKDREHSQVEQLKSPYRGQTPEEVLETALGLCKEVKAVLGSKAAEDEAAGFVDWTITVGEKVANAAKEGGFFSAGDKVSEEEALVIGEVKKVFA